MSVTLVSTLNYSNLNTFDIQQKRQLESAIKTYQNMISAYLDLSSSIEYKLNHYLTGVVQQQNQLSKKYTEDRYNANAVLSSWLIKRYDDGQDIRTQQTTTSSLYQNRIYKLRKLYKHRALSSLSQLDDFQRWYQPLMIINKGNATLSCDCEDYDINYLYTNAYPHSTFAGGYSSKFLTMPYNQIYSLSSITYVIDYPKNVTTLQNYDAGTIELPDGLLHQCTDRNYTNPRSASIYNKYKELVDYRNNIKQQTYKKLVKKQRHKAYVNSRIVTTQEEISAYNNIVSAHVQDVYMTADSMNSTLYQQNNKTIQMTYPWAITVSSILYNYKHRVYPPKNSDKSQGYGQDFYDLSNIFDQ